MQRSRRRRAPQLLLPGGQGGFTLLELLVVIAVLGVLSGVAVFSMGTITDQAEQSACAADERVLVTAVEAYSAATGAVVDEDTLVAAGYLSAPSSSHDVVLVGAGYTIVPTGDCVDGGSEEIAGGGDTAPENGDDPAAGPVAPEVKDDPATVDTKPDDTKPDDTDDKGDVKDPGEGDSSCTKGQIDLNFASLKELGTIPHVNPARAEQIVKLRPFRSLDELVRVDGIEKKHLAQIDKQACV